MNPEKPWLDEPNSDKFMHAGLPCVLIRRPMGSWCGYVGVPPSHPLFKKECHFKVPLRADLKDAKIGKRGFIPLLLGSLDAETPWVSLDVYFDVHGSLTYAGKLEDSLTANMPMWWLGFDCGHCGDLSPGMEKFYADFAIPGDTRVYRDIEYVRQECRSLAEQLACFTTWRMRWRLWMARLRYGAAKTEES